MNNPKPDKPLSTADMAAAADKPAADQAGAPAPAQGRPPAGAPKAVAGNGARKAEGQPAPLLSPEETQKFRAHWDSIQTGFVDEPRRAVEQADGLVAEVMKRLAETFAQERSKLESQWSRGDNVSTEDLRVALRRYRSFFDRLLSM